MIGIIGAMEEEVAELKKDMQIDETIEQAGMVFCKGSLGGKDVVIVRSGIGKVNAGICAQILVDRFGVDTLINTIWMRRYSEIRQDRSQEWTHCHSRQMKNWSRRQ